ncbi:hypothetical protein [Hyphococcus sp.]|uniref:hypothetical protein n=1 Tax=Hyphococcus sp. TaxID=2038636 RepID=UPI003CCBB446
MTDFFDLSHKANMALEGSIPGDEGLQHIHIYADAMYEANAEKWRSEGTEGAALAFFFAYLRQAADPDGDSKFRIRIQRRDTSKSRERTPKEQRDWESKNVMTALTIAKLVERDKRNGKPKTQDGWLHHFIGLEGITRSDFFDAKKTELYKRMLPKVLASLDN